MEATLQKLEATSVAEEPRSPTDSTMQEAIATPPETPSKALGQQLANAGLDSAKKGVSLLKLVWPNPQSSIIQ